MQTLDLWISIGHHISMKTNKKKAINQRQIIEKKLAPWASERLQYDPPPSGWIKAIRGSLGITTRQLAEHLDVNHSVIQQLEKREVKGTASLELLNKVAGAMGCKLVYAIIPKKPNTNLDDILNERAQLAAKEVLQRAEHSMQLEAQGNSTESYQIQLNELAAALKSTGDPHLWDKKFKIRQKKIK